MSFSEMVDAAAGYICSALPFIVLFGMVSNLKASSVPQDYKSRDDAAARDWRRKKFEREHLRVNHNNEINADDLTQPLDAEDED